MERNNINQYRQNLKAYSTDLQRYENLLDGYLGTELDRRESITELSGKSFSDKTKTYLVSIINNAKEIISNNLSDSLLPLNRIIEISTKINQLEVGLKKLELPKFSKRIKC